MAKGVKKEGFGNHKKFKLLANNSNGPDQIENNLIWRQNCRKSYT